MKKDSYLRLRDFLETGLDRYNRPSFIENDPIQIPHRFSKREDIEISAFLTSTIAWGNRRSIIKNASRLVEIMDMAPHEFVISATDKDLKKLDGFVHRTFNSEDCKFFIRSLKHIYDHRGGLKNLFESSFRATSSVKETLSVFRDAFFDEPHDYHARKHISDVEKNSAAKRLNLFLMWMCRKDGCGVHFGLWDIPASELRIPLDVHCGNVGRATGLLSRKQNDWKAVEELTAALRVFDPKDPVKYDFALFGMGESGEYRKIS